MKYIIMQDGNGWSGYLEGYQEHEIYGESFEDLQIKLWQLHQELAQESERNQYRHHGREHGHYGESFEDLQIKLWQLHQELIAQESERNQYRHHGREHGHYGNGEHDRHHNHASTLSRRTPTMSRAQIKRRARVEQLLFAMISNR